MKQIDYFYNITPDLIKYLNVEIPPILNPKTKRPFDPRELLRIFPEGLIKQEAELERDKIPVPKEVLKIYSTYRPTSLKRAYRLEEYLKTPARIYYKVEGETPSGSHKLNTALMQAYFAKQEGIETLTTETGAGQWGTALSIADSFFGIKTKVFMVRISYIQKPFRKTIMKIFGAEVIPSPSDKTKSGKNFLKNKKNYNGSLGMAISEALEVAATNQKVKYALGSVLNSVLMHQTIIGEEAKQQLKKYNDYPDIVIGCVGGGSNFAGISFPFIKEKLRYKKKIKIIAVEPKACPTLTEGEYRYDFGDSAGLTPLLKMHTLGSGFVPEPIHAGGLRYHGVAPLVSILKNKGIIETRAYGQKEVFGAAILFSKTEGIVPAPESAHAIKAAIDEALKAKKGKKEKTILFNLSGFGYFDLKAYEDFLEGKLE